MTRADLSNIVPDPKTEAKVVEDLAFRAGQAQVFDIVEGRLRGVAINGGVEQIDLEEYEAHPSRKSGSASLTDPDSFVTYANRHKHTADTTLWSNVDRGTVTAVFNDHADGIDVAGWADHRATLTLASTPDWLHWLKLDGKFVRQQDFAEHLEDGAAAVRQPSAADMLEIAQTFHAKNNVAFKSSSRLTSGEVQLQFEETITAKAGQKGSIEIPEVITLGLQPFEGSLTYELAARFRYRISDGVLLLGYRLVRPDLVRKAAFDDLTAVISEGIGLPVLAGTR